MPCTSFARKLHELCRKRCAQTLERTPRPVFCGYLGKAPLLGRVLLLPAPPEYLATHASSQLNSSGACDGPARCCIARGVPTRSLYRQPWPCGEGGTLVALCVRVWPLPWVLQGGAEGAYHLGNIRLHP